MQDENISVWTKGQNEEKKMLVEVITNVSDSSYTQTSLTPVRWQRLCLSSPSLQSLSVGETKYLNALNALWHTWLVRKPRLSLISL